MEFAARNQDENIEPANMDFFLQSEHNINMAPMINFFLHKILQNKCQEFPEKPGWVSKTGEFHDRPRRYKLI